MNGDDLKNAVGIVCAFYAMAMQGWQTGYWGMGYFDWKAWLIIGGFSLFVIFIWKMDNR